MFKFCNALFVYDIATETTQWYCFLLYKHALCWCMAMSRQVLTLWGVALLLQIAIFVNDLKEICRCWGWLFFLSIYNKLQITIFVNDLKEICRCWGWLFSPSIYNKATISLEWFDTLRHFHLQWRSFKHMNNKNWYYHSYQVPNCSKPKLKHYLKSPDVQRQVNV